MPSKFSIRSLLAGAILALSAASASAQGTISSLSGHTTNYYPYSFLATGIPTGAAPIWSSDDTGDFGMSGLAVGASFAVGFPVASLTQTSALLASNAASGANPLTCSIAGPAFVIPAKCQVATAQIQNIGQSNLAGTGAGYTANTNEPVTDSIGDTVGYIEIDSVGTGGTITGSHLYYNGAFNLVAGALPAPPYQIQGGTAGNLAYANSLVFQTVSETLLDAGVGYQGGSAPAMTLTAAVGQQTAGTGTATVGAAQLARSSGTIQTQGGSPIVPVTGSTTLTTAQCGDTIFDNTAGAATLTLPSPITVGCRFTAMQGPNSGALSFAAGAGASASGTIATSSSAPVVTIRAATTAVEVGAVGYGG